MALLPFYLLTMIKVYELNKGIMTKTCQLKCSMLLDASSHLYKSVCLSVSIRRSVRPLVSLKEMGLIRF